MDEELSFESVMSILDETSVSEDRAEEFYAVAQLIALGPHISPVDFG